MEYFDDGNDIHERSTRNKPQNQENRMRDIEIQWRKETARTTILIESERML